MTHEEILEIFHECDEYEARLIQERKDPYEKTDCNFLVLCNGVEPRCLWKHHIFHK